MNTKRSLLTATILVALGLFLTATETFAQNTTKAKNSVAAQNQNGTSGRHFVDADGDGICDFDVDKDGIPNRNDPDFVRPQDGTGRKMGQANGSGKGYGPRDGSGNQGIGPRDGSGYGAKSVNRTATGTCDGTGPKGNATRGKK